MLARQAFHDARLRRMQPVQSSIQSLGMQSTHAQDATQGVRRRVVAEHTPGGEFRAWGDDARDDHGEQRLGQCPRRRGEPILGAAGQCAAKDGGNVAMREAAFHGEDVVGTGYRHTALEENPEAFDNLGGKTRQVGEGALLCWR